MFLRKSSIFWKQHSICSLCIKSSNLKLVNKHYNKLFVRFCTTTDDDGVLPKFPGEKLKRIENEYFHSLLMKDKKFVNTIAFLDCLKEVEECKNVQEILTTDFSQETVGQLISHLRSVLSCEENRNISKTEEFKSLCDALISKVRNLNDEQVLLVLKVLTLWPGKEVDPNFYNICKAIDKQLLMMFRSWPTDKILYGMDHFYRLEVIRFSEFVWTAMKRVLREPAQ